jgi:hypothetical protein
VLLLPRLLEQRVVHCASSAPIGMLAHARSSLERVLLLSRRSVA